MNRDLAEAIEFHNAIIEEGSKALVGYDTAKALANVVLLSEIPTTYDKSESRSGPRSFPPREPGPTDRETDPSPNFIR